MHIETITDPRDPLVLPLDPYGPVTQDSIIAAIDACNAERARIFRETGIYYAPEPYPAYLGISKEAQQS